MAPNKARKPSEGYTPRTNLRVVQGGKKNPKQHARLVWAFISLCTVSLIGLYLYSVDTTDTLQLTDRRFFGLHDIYKHEGILRFQEEKQRLKKQIAETLKNNPDEAEQRFATNVAVYLFPEILPDTNFEKGIAQEQWGTFQEAIEKQPRTAESRIFFEELRANIWNYESPDRQNPRLTPFAKEALKIYDEISSQ